MIDNYGLYEAHERKMAKLESLCLKDCEGDLIAPDEPYYEIDGKLYSQQTIDRYKHYCEE